MPGVWESEVSEDVEVREEDVCGTPIRHLMDFFSLVMLAEANPGWPAEGGDERID